MQPEHDYEHYYSLKPGDIYVEAGAYLGAYGQIASQKVGPQGKVILIEPVPTHIAALQNLQLPNALIVPKCVWSSPGKTLFAVYGHPLSYHKMAPFENGLSISVDQDTLDNILRNLSLEKVDLLACDVEGAEVELVKGLSNYLSEKRILNMALMAYHQPGYPEQIKQLLSQQGYREILIEALAVYAHV